MNQDEILKYIRNCNNTTLLIRIKLVIETRQRVLKNRVISRKQLNN